MADRQPLNRLGDFLRDKRQWYKLPRLFAMVRLIEIRNELRAKNLHDTEEPPLEKRPIPPNLDPALREARTTDGTYNDLHVPADGRGRAAASAATSRSSTRFPTRPNLLMPNPRVVSRELMTRDAVPAGDDPQPARRGVDSVHGARLVRAQAVDDATRIDIPTARRATTGRRAEHARAADRVPDAGAGRLDAAAGLRQPEQPLVGRVADLRLRRRHVRRSCARDVGGKLRIEPTGLLPVDPETGVDFTGFTDNWWIGLAMLHTLFTLEHNYICDLLAHAASGLERRAAVPARRKLINSALMAKIHTVEWTPAILPHPIIKLAMNVNWSGLVGEDSQDVFEFLDDDELLGGIVGSHADHHARAVLADRGVRRRLPHAPADAGRLSRSTPPTTGERARDARRCPRSPASSTPRDRRAHHDAGSVLLVRHVPSGRGDAAQLSAAPAEPDARRRRAPRPGGRRHPARSRARRAALQPVPPAAAQGAGQVVRRADRQPGVARADQAASTTTTSRRSI